MMFRICVASSVAILKTRFVVQQHMAQNSFIMNAIDHEVMQVAPTPTVITASLARNITLNTS